MAGKTDERNKEIFNLRDSGHTHKAIAERFGISIGRVAQIIEKQQRKVRLEEAKKKQIPQDIYRNVRRNFIPEKVCVNDDGFIIHRWECCNPFCKAIFGHFSSYDAIKCSERVPVGDCIKYFSKAVADVQLTIERSQGQR